MMRIRNFPRTLINIVSGARFRDQQTFQFLAYTLVIQWLRRFSSDDHDILGSRKPVPVQPEKLSDKAFHPVSLDSVPNLFTDRQSQSREPRRIRADDSGEMQRITPHPLPVYVLIFFSFSNPILLAKGLPAHAFSDRFPDSRFPEALFPKRHLRQGFAGLCRLPSAG